MTLLLFALLQSVCIAWVYGESNNKKEKNRGFTKNLNHSLVSCILPKVLISFMTSLKTWSDTDLCLHLSTSWNTWPQWSAWWVWFLSSWFFSICSISCCSFPFCLVQPHSPEPYFVLHDLSLIYRIFNLSLCFGLPHCNTVRLDSELTEMSRCVCRQTSLMEMRCSVRFFSVGFCSVRFSSVFHFSVTDKQFNSKWNRSLLKN